MINIFKSKILIKVKGKNINRFIKKLIVRKINILSLKYISNNEIIIIIYKKDYKKVQKIKSIYEIFEEDTFGLIKIKKLININKHLIFIFIFCFSCFYLLTHMIFEIEIVHTNKEIRNLLKEELKNNKIKKYAFKKNYNEIKKIKQNILNKYPDKIEWLEIEQEGTKYIIRAEERELPKKNINNKPRNIIASKDAVIKNVVASSGVVIKDQDSYVKKGDIIVTGEVMLNEKVKGKVKAQGKVYGEVWYVITTEYPFVYYEEKETGKKKNLLAIKFLNKDIELTANKFKHKKIDEKTIIENKLLPIKIVKQCQKEIKIKNEILTFDQALIKAKKHAVNKMTKNLKENEYIIRNKYLKSRIKKSTIEVDMFFAIYENITEYKEIEW